MHDDIGILRYFIIVKNIKWPNMYTYVKIQILSLMVVILTILLLRDVW